MNAQNLHTGIDRLHLVVPIEGPPEFKKKNLTVGGANVHVERFYGKGIRKPMVYVDVCPSAVVNPTSADAATVPETQVVMAEVWDTAIGNGIGLLGTLNDAYVSMIHLTDDFPGAVHPSAILRGMSEVPRSRTPRELVMDRTTGEPGTLYVGRLLGTPVGGGYESMYRKDRDPKLRGPVTENTLRVESVVAGKTIKDLLALPTYGSLCEDTLDQLAQARFDWALFGIPVTTGEDLYEKVMRTTPGLSPTQRNNLFGDLVGIDHGVSPSSARRKAAARRWTQEHGPHSLDPMASGLVIVQTLDWDTRTVLVHLNDGPGAIVTIDTHRKRDPEMDPTPTTTHPKGGTVASILAEYIAGTWTPDPAPEPVELVGTAKVIEDWWFRGPLFAVENNPADIVAEATRLLASVIKEPVGP